MKRAALVMWAVVLAAGCGSRETVVVYSPHGADVLGDYEERFEAAYPEVDVQWLYMGSQDVYARISGERSRPMCDVWWGAPSTMFMKAAEEGLLAPYRPSWADDVPGVPHDEQDRWYAVFQSPLAIVYNTRGREADSVPKTWDGLLDPEWKGKITIRKPPPSGTMRTFVGAMILRAGSEDAGIDWLKRLDASTESYPAKPQELFDHMRKNLELITVWLLPDVVLERERNGFPGGYVVPKPAPVLTEAIAIVKGAPHEEWARRFYEFVTRENELAHQAQAYAKMPVREDLDASALPEWVAALDIEAMDIDWKAFAEHEKDWLDRWEREVYSAR